MEPPQGTSAFRIAFVTYEYPPQVYGGAGTYAAAMCTALASLGVEVHVVTPAEPPCPDPPGIVRHVVPSGSLRLLRIPRFWWGLKTWWKAIARRAGGFDAVVGNGFSVLPLSSRNMSCPLVTVMHQSARDVIRILRPTLLERLRNINNELGAAPLFDPVLARRADHLVAVSAYVKDALVRDLHIPPDKISVIPNGVTDRGTALGPEEREVLAAHHAAVGKKILLFVGRPADKRKGLAALIEALPCILENEPVMLLVAGSGDTNAHRRQAERLGIAHAVRFLGYVSDVELSTLYALCDLFVSSSYYESFGLTLAEAMTAGTPVVARDVGGTAEVVRPGTGILVRESGPRALADAILRALADPSLGAINRTYALEAFSWEQGARALYAILGRLIEEKGGASCRP